MADDDSSNFNIDSDLSNNAMSGYLPEELGQLQNLDSLWALFHHAISMNFDIWSPYKYFTDL